MIRKVLVRIFVPKSIFEAVVRVAMGCFAAGADWGRFFANGERWPIWGMAIYVVLAYGGMRFLIMVHAMLKIKALQSDAAVESAS